MSFNRRMVLGSFFALAFLGGSSAVAFSQAPTQTPEGEPVVLERLKAGVWQEAADTDRDVFVYRFQQDNQWCFIASTVVSTGVNRTGQVAAGIDIECVPKN